MRVLPKGIHTEGPFGYVACGTGGAFVIWENMCDLIFFRLFGVNVTRVCMD